MEEYTLINKNRKRTKVFKLFKDVRNSSPFIDGMQIISECVYQKADKPVMLGRRVEIFEDARKEYKKLLEEGWKKTSIFKVTYLQ